ncbi:hypothetical protein [Pseudothauera lacus]|uniref:Uncharacterized protein n=1 Tax=Pseudothauera lacus TaxID=2136175 RepID=A0A2T4IG22_9RHOO|nr:hypothetical protein [Pseudothauera lacus]PTD96729.1 hypothetical protein C8261_07915 [Pseudothauera lacus]
MDDVGAFFSVLGDLFDFIGLLALAGSGALLGGVVGVVAILILHRVGLLRRRVRWHHFLLKTYFVLIPVFGGLLGAQLATVYGMQAQMHRTVETFRPDVRAWAEQSWNDYVRGMSDEDVNVLLGRVESVGALGTAELLVDAFLDRQGLTAGGFTAPDGVSGRALSVAVEFFHSKPLRGQLVKALTAEVAKLSGVSEETAHFVLTSPMREVLSGDVLVDLLQKKFAEQFRILYWMVLFQLLLVVVLLALEVVISRYFGFSVRAAGGHGTAAARVA